MLSSLREKIHLEMEEADTEHSAVVTFPLHFKELSLLALIFACKMQSTLFSPLTLQEYNEAYMKLPCRHLFCHKS